MKKMIMTRAWAIAKAAAKETGEKASQFFRESLKMAWAEYRNMDLVGSEKQVAWARKIKKECTFAISLSKKIMAACVEAAERRDNQEKKAEFLSYFAKLEKIENQKSAAWWIENGKHHPVQEWNNSALHQLRSAILNSNPIYQMRAIVAALTQKDI